VVAWVYLSAAGKDIWTLDLVDSRLIVVVLACCILSMADICFVAHLSRTPIHCTTTTEHLGCVYYSLAERIRFDIDSGNGIWSFVI
jgi:hypothetical protein